jgi:hypothetical protein
MVTEQMWNGFARESLAEFVSNCSSVCQRLPDRDEDAHIGWQHQHGPRRLSISTGIMPPDARVRGSAGGTSRKSSEGQDHGFLTD